MKNVENKLQYFRFVFIIIIILIKNIRTNMLFEICKLITNLNSIKFI